jgi:hypothetical protein
MPTRGFRVVVLGVLLVCLGGPALLQAQPAANEDKKEPTGKLEGKESPRPT